MLESPPPQVFLNNYKRIRVEAIENQTQKICKFNGELEYTQYAGEIERTHRNSIQNNTQSIHTPCSMSTFYTSPDNRADTSADST